mgnify:CR=1 FL=1
MRKNRLLSFHALAISLLVILLPVSFSNAAAARTTATNQTLAYKEPRPGFNKHVLSAMKQWQVPGLGVAVVKDDKLVFAKGYGV